MADRKQRGFIFLAMLLMVTGCAGSSDNFVGRILPDWSEPAPRAEGPGVRPTARVIDANTPYPNLASVPPRPHIDWQSRFDDVSAGLTKDLQQATALQQGQQDTLAPSDTDVAAKGDDVVPLPPVLTPVPSIDVSKPLPSLVRQSNTVLPPPPPLQRKPPPPTISGQNVSSVTVPEAAPEKQPPSIKDIAPILGNDKRVREEETRITLKQDVLNQNDADVAHDMGGDVLRLRFAATTTDLDSAQQEAVKKLAVHASNNHKRVRIQLFVADTAGDSVIDRAMTRGAGIAAELVKNGLARRSIILASPDSAADSQQEKTALVTILP